MPALYKLDDVVSEYIDRTDKDHLNGYARFLKMAKSGLRDLNMDVSGVSKIIDISVDQNTLTYNLPADYLNYQGVYVCIGEQLHPLGLNDKICLNREVTDCGIPADRINFPEPNDVNGLTGQGGPLGWWYGDNIKVRDGQMYGGYFGLGGGNNVYGYYRPDPERALMQFSNIMYFDLVMEYLADISQVDGQYLVVPQVKEALIAWITWRNISSKENVSEAVVNAKMREYYREKRNAKLRLNPIRISEAYQAIRSTFRQTPKI